MGPGPLVVALRSWAGCDPTTAAGDGLGLRRPKGIPPAALEIPIDSLAVSHYQSGRRLAWPPVMEVLCSILPATVLGRCHLPPHPSTMTTNGPSPNNITRARLAVPCHVCLSLETEAFPSPSRPYALRPLPSPSPYPAIKYLVPSIHTIGALPPSREPGRAHRHDIDSSFDLATLAVPRVHQSTSFSPA